MEKIIATHYVQKPGGGVAIPGEVIPPEAAVQFTGSELERLIKLGAIRIEYMHEDVQGDDLPLEELHPAEEPEAEETELEEIEEYEIEPEPMEIDAMDGIVQDEPKPKRSSTGRRKSK